MPKRAHENPGDSDDDDSTSHDSSVINIDDDEPPQKKAKGEDQSFRIAAFNKQYKVHARTHEEVLGELSTSPHSLLADQSTRGAKETMDLEILPAFPRARDL